MSANSKQVKDRISSVKNIAKMTKTMEMVSSAKMKRAMAQVAAGRPYAQGVLQLLVKLKHQRGLKHELFRERRAGKILYVLIGSDRGLCGGYNTRIERLVREEIKKDSVDVITIGKTLTKNIKRTKKPVRTFLNLGTATRYQDVQRATEEIEKIFTEDTLYQKVFIVHTQFSSALSPTVISAQILPLHLESLTTVHGIDLDTFENIHMSSTTVEPSEDGVAQELVPDLFRSLMYQFIIESYASEQAMRMAAMRQATDNADSLQEELFYEYNRARQAAVTQEITEIMNTAAALE